MFCSLFDSIMDIVILYVCSVLYYVYIPVLICQIFVCIIISRIILWWARIFCSAFLSWYHQGLTVVVVVVINLFSFLNPDHWNNFSPEPRSSCKYFFAKETFVLCNEVTNLYQMILFSSLASFAIMIAQAQTDIISY